MESDLKLICSGQISKEQVVSNCLEEMKQVFQDVVSNAVLIDQTISTHFRPLSDSASVIHPRFSTCGQCKNKMQLKV